MSGSDSFKFFMKDWLVETLGLTAEETGVYVTLVAMLQRGRPIADRDPKGLARACGTTRARLLKCLERLEWLGLIERADGYYSAPIIDRWAAKARAEERRPRIPWEVRDAVVARDGQRCTYCGDTDGPFHLDHRVPWSRGGDHTVDNLTVACATCNLAKSDLTDDEFMGASQ